MSKKYEKSCKTCKFVCKKDKPCKNFLPGIESYQVCFYDKIGEETLDSCFDENFVFPTEKGSIPFESIGFITSYLDKYNSVDIDKYKNQLSIGCCVVNRTFICKIFILPIAKISEKQYNIYITQTEVIK